MIIGELFDEDIAKELLVAKPDDQLFQELNIAEMEGMELKKKLEALS